MLIYLNRRRLVVLLRYVFFATLVFGLVLGVVPGPQIPGPEYSDKIAHGLFFLLLAILYCLGFAVRALPWSIFLALVGYGLLIESVQFFIPWRTFSIADLLADAAGLLLYMLAARLWARASVGLGVT